MDVLCLIGIYSFVAHLSAISLACAKKCADVKSVYFFAAHSLAALYNLKLRLTNEIS